MAESQLGMENHRWIVGFIWLDHFNCYPSSMAWGSRFLASIIRFLYVISFDLLCCFVHSCSCSARAAILGLFEGEINIYEKGLTRFLKIKKMRSREYSKSELLLQEEEQPSV
jgi:hypothetical protein